MPVLTSDLDLGGLVSQVSSFGFSASTGVTYESHEILRWNLSVEVLPESNSNSTEGQNGKNSKKITIGVAVGVEAPLLVLLCSGVMYYGPQIIEHTQETPGGTQRVQVSRTEEGSQQFR